MPETALGGIKVIEYASLVSGPYCGKLLADLGAEVIKVEPPGGDAARRKGPFPGDIPHPEKSGLFLYLNTNKNGVTLNLEHPKGRELFSKLAKDADVLIEGETPGRMEGWGLGYERLRALNPGLIMTSITPFGQTGPYARYRAYHLNLVHSCGQAYLIRQGAGNFEAPPLRSGGLVSEYDVGMAAALATLIALYGRGDTGEGQHLDISAQEALMALERVELGRYVNSEPVSSFSAPVRVGGLLETEDGHFDITPVEDHQWQALVELMGNPSWAQKEEYKDAVNRAALASEIQPRLKEWARGQKKVEVLFKGQEMSIPFGVPLSAEELYADPQLQAREFFQPVAHPVAGEFLYPTAPYKFSETPWRLERPAPCLGEHNQEVYSRLGYSSRALKRLKQEGAL